ncbi:MAG: putative lipid II flippase FtsW [Terrimicrobiaceae bacterium]
MHRNAIYVLLLTVAALSCLGMVMLSSTAAFAYESRGDMYFFVKRQGMWLAIAVCGAVVAGWLDYRIWKRLWPFLLAVTMVLLVLCFIPPIGLKINGSSRWVNLGFTNFQPSELAKLSSLFFMAWWFEKHEKDSKKFFKGVFVPMAFLGALVLPILLEVDMGTSALIMGAGLAVMFLAGTAFKWLAMMGAGVVALGAYVVTHLPERMDRVLAFLDPEKYRLGEGLQQWQALIAFGSGGIDGLGLGEGRQKMLYLPYAHTDFIFPMIGEELGLKFTLATVICYLVLCLCGTQVALNARDRFGTLLAFGCVMTLTIQAAVNIGVTTSLLPNKGMPLPFISFGGSGLAICYFMVGLLVSIHRHGQPFSPAVSTALRRSPTFCRL